MKGKKSKAKKLPEPEKAQQAILFIADQLKDSPGFGKVLLEKTLFYSDQRAYLLTGKTITGLSYVRQRFGPTVDPKQMLPLTKALEDQGKARWEIAPGRFGTKRLIPLKPASENLRSLSESELSILREQANKISGENATSASDESHKKVLAWKIASNMEELPAFTALVSEAPVRESDLAWARQQIERR